MSAGLDGKPGWPGVVEHPGDTLRTAVTVPVSSLVTLALLSPSIPSLPPPPPQGRRYSTSAVRSEVTSCPDSGNEHVPTGHIGRHRDVMSLLPCPGEQHAGPHVKRNLRSYVLKPVGSLACKRQRR